jgi:hypothetical protein
MNNSLKYVKILESSGITREQAEAHVQMISEILEDDLATKQDVHNLKQDIKNLDIRFESIEHKILQSEYRMTIKLGSIVTLSMAALAAVIKFF